MSGNPIMNAASDVWSGTQRAMLAVNTLGMSEVIPETEKRIQEAEKKYAQGQMSSEAPPTLDEAVDKTKQKNRAATYGRGGTIKTSGGYRGLASSMLNLGGASLLGK